MAHAHSRADEPLRIDILQLHIVALEEAVSEAEKFLTERRGALPPAPPEAGAE